MELWAEEWSDKRLKDSMRSWPGRQTLRICNDGEFHLLWEAGKLERWRQDILARPTEAAKTWLTGMLKCTDVSLRFLEHYLYFVPPASNTVTDC